MSVKTGEKRKVLAKKETFYVENPKLLNAFKSWRDANYEIEMPDYIARSILKIVNGCAKMPGFSQYTFLDDMKGEAILQCVKYANRFNFDYDSPYSYITMIVCRAFVQTMKKEKIHFKRIMQFSEQLDASMNFEKMKEDFEKTLATENSEQNSFEKDLNEKEEEQEEQDNNDVDVHQI